MSELGIVIVLAYDMTNKCMLDPDPNVIINAVSVTPFIRNSFVYGYLPALDTLLTTNGIRVASSINLPPSFAGYDVVFLISGSGNQALKDWVSNGGVLITQYDTSYWPLSQGMFGSAQYLGNALSGGTLTIDATGYMIPGATLATRDLFMGVSSYSDSSSTEYFVSISGTQTYQTLGITTTGQDVFFGE